MTSEVLGRLAEEWAELVSECGSAPGTDLLVTSRALVMLAWFHYELLVHACLISLQAVEASIRQSGYPTVAGGVPLMKLVNRAERDRILDGARAEAVRHGVLLRNELSHPEFQSAYTLGMVETIVRVSHVVVRDLTLWRRSQVPIGSD